MLEEDAVLIFRSNRGPLSALVHPNCDDHDDVRDHTQRATWLGERIVLDVDMLRRFVAKRDADKPLKGS